MRLVYFLVLLSLCISLNANPVSESDSDVTEPILGGLSDADVNNPDIKNAAAFALSEIDRRQNSAFKQVLVQIVRAQTQVVAGTLYHLRLEVGASNCRKGKQNVSDECTLKEESNRQVCDVKVWERPWLNATEVTEVSCSGKTSRRKRETLVGGLADADINEEGVKNAANFALTEVEKRSNSAYKQTLVQIRSAKKQVVSGTLYHLELEVGESSCDKGSSKANSECTLRKGSNNQICTVKVWDRPWLKKTEVTQVDCSAKSQRRRRAGVPGGLTDADVNEEGVKNAAQFAFTEVEKRSNSAYKQTLVKILSAKRQVVSGTLYHLQLEVGESSCDKGSSKADSECTLREGSNNQICTVKVWVRPWLKKTEVTQVDCSAKSQRRRRATADVPLRGGLHDADTDDVDIKSAAAFAVTGINNRQNSENKLVLVQILKAQSQVVEGSLHHLKLEIGESNCTNTNSGAASECTLKENSALPNVSSGGLEDADLNYEDVKNAAAFAVSQIDKQQDSEYKLVLDEIVSAQMQIVSGTIYYLEIKVGQSNCTKGNDVATTECMVQENMSNQICNVQVYEVPWENKLEASNINCVPNLKRQKKS